MKLQVFLTVTWEQLSKQSAFLREMVGSFKLRNTDDQLRRLSVKTPGLTGP